MGPGPLGIADTRPIADAPYPMAMRASSMLAMQQILTRGGIMFLGLWSWIFGLWAMGFGLWSLIYGPGSLGVEVGSNIKYPRPNTKDLSPTSEVIQQLSHPFEI